MCNSPFSNPEGTFVLSNLPRVMTINITINNNIKVHKNKQNEKLTKNENSSNLT